MEQSELERLRAEKAQMCQQLADATAALDKVASNVRDLPKLQMPVVLLSQKVAGRPRENHLFLEIPGSPRRLR
jgi:hypothetical protein